MENPSRICRKTRETGQRRLIYLASRVNRNVGGMKVELRPDNSLISGSLVGKTDLYHGVIHNTLHDNVANYCIMYVNRLTRTICRVYVTLATPIKVFILRGRGAIVSNTQ